MEAFEDSCWTGLYHYNSNSNSSSINFDASDFFIFPGVRATNDASLMDHDVIEKEPKTGRERKRRSCQAESKACREKSRREKMNIRFTELSEFLHPRRPAKVDKVATLKDAILALNKLQSQLMELSDKKIKLQHDITCLKEEKKELREEKEVLRARKESIKERLKATGDATPKSKKINNSYQATVCGGIFPMWQWIPFIVLDTSLDHMLRPPTA